LKKFDSEYQPVNRRTRNKLTLVLEAIKSEKLLGTDDTTSREDAEKAVFAYLAKAAFSPTPETAPLASTCMTALLKKAWPDSKPTNEPVTFKFDRSLPAVENADSVMTAVACGGIAPDVGALLIGMIKDTIQISESTQLVERLEAIEKALNSK
jgi:hypothetical protein